MKRFYGLGFGACICLCLWMTNALAANYDLPVSGKARVPYMQGNALKIPSAVIWYLWASR